MTETAIAFWTFSGWSSTGRVSITSRLPRFQSRSCCPPSAGPALPSKPGSGLRKVVFDYPLRRSRHSTPSVPCRRGCVLSVGGQHPETLLRAIEAILHFPQPRAYNGSGAGPSGLAAAKSLLHDAPPGTFDVTVFDSKVRIGGLWPSHKDDSTGLVHPYMVANQSIHTVQFSDLAWPEDAPQLPQAWKVGQYLAAYLERYCSGAKLRLGTRVDKAEPLGASTTTSSGSPSSWRVRTCSTQGGEREEVFDHLIVASGFFGKPTLPPVSGHAHHRIPVIHSSQYRNLPDLFGNTGRSGGKILVVGGQMSGVEVAGTIATHLSSATHSPEPSPIPNPDKYTVHHIVQRPVWVFPLYTSPNVRLWLNYAIRTCPC